MRILLVDLHGALADAARQEGWPGEVLPWTSLNDVVVAYEPGSAVVSPANSLGFMDGGVDWVISRLMFPGVEPALREALATGVGDGKSERTHLGRPFLPIGRALAVPVPDRPGVHMVSAPTMWLPQDVRGTRNAYHATHAALTEAARVGASTVVFPGMCTGCGMLAPTAALQQMSDAVHDWVAGRPAQWDAVAIAAEQPNTYDNTEFRPLPTTSELRMAAAAGVRHHGPAVEPAAKPPGPHPTHKVPPW